MLADKRRFLFKAELMRNKLKIPTLAVLRRIQYDNIVSLMAIPIWIKMTKYGEKVAISLKEASKHET